ncbi:LuxR C-terminal-related transcriptional regulator [Amycolatopsis sp. NBC_01307]|uniref:helix-turn-helix transcriptional regulator n=1 Tax=Amycolatopsis sp. NBC_01307 TaxID=2903561 RepID=UPI002E146654|nr:LuxR C-terminal-related transcriptional regulator [Amycolatopsis sp. NBC_01307]
MQQAILIGPDTINRAAVAALLARAYDFDPHRVFDFEQIDLARAALADQDSLVFVLYPAEDDLQHRCRQEESRASDATEHNNLIFLVTSLSSHDAQRILSHKPRGVVYLHEGVAHLHDVIYTVEDGRRAVSNSLTLSAWAARESPLTPREREVLTAAAAGSPPKEVATALGLATGTVRNHLAAIQSKLRTRSLVDSIRVAQDSGWIT